MRLEEQKFQGWRAIAVRGDGTEHLLYVGQSYEQVKKNFAGSFYEILTEEEQRDVVKISLDRWHGVADSGKWMRQDSVKVPTVLKNRVVEQGVL